jgi:hypothetical protein
MLAHQDVILKITSHTWEMLNDRYTRASLMLRSFPTPECMRIVGVLICLHREDRFQTA